MAINNFLFVKGRFSHGVIFICVETLLQNIFLPDIFYLYVFQSFEYNLNKMKTLSYQSHCQITSANNLHHFNQIVAPKLTFIRNIDVGIQCSIYVCIQG